ncbi:MAG TPA: hypothetical protein VLD66_06220 [Methyloceanibacter sp.]|nr:hypothetical protein [Methyloceanibacter sp.]
MLPMLITLPGPGSNAPPAIEVEVLHSAPSAAAKPEADPATTSALPLVKEAPALKPAPIELAPSAADVEAAPEPVKPDSTPAPSVAESNPAEVVPTKIEEQTLEPAKPEASPIEQAPDDTPQQLSPEVSSPTQVLVSPEPEAVATPSPAPPAPVETKTPGDDSNAATAEPDAPVDETPSVQPDVVRSEPAQPEAKSLDESPAEAEEPSAPEVARTEPKAETPAPAPPAKISVPAKKPEPRAEPKVKASAKAEPAATKKRPIATAKRASPQTRRVVRTRPQTAVNQGILSLFSFRPPAGNARAAPRRPATQSATQAVKAQ